MVTKDLRKLLEKLDPHLTRALEQAIGFAIARTHYEVTLEHLLLKLLEDGGGDIPRIFRRFAVDDRRVWEALLGRLELVAAGNTGRPHFSPSLSALVESAWVSASVQHALREVRSGNLLEAVLTSESLRLEPYVEPLGVIREDALRAEFFEIVAGSEEDRAAGEQRRGPALATEDARPSSGETALDLYTLDLTGRARAGEIDPVFGRDQEIRQIIDILSRRRKNNPVLVGDAGVGKTAVVEGLALRIAERDVPDSLADVELRTLDLGLLQAGAGVKGEFEQRLKSVIQEVRSAPRPIILFIDEAHTLIGAGGAAGTSDAANLLKPALARGALRTIAATTWSEYKRYFERDAALERRFQLVKIEEPTVETATTMLRGIKSIYERHHNVHIPDHAVTAAVKLASRFISGRQLPDKAVDLLDTASARVRMAQTARPAALDILEREIRDVRTRIAALERDAAAGTVQDPATLGQLKVAMIELETRRDALARRWETEHELARRVIAVRERLFAGIGREPGRDTAHAPSEPVLVSELARLEAELSVLQGAQPLVPTTVDPDIAAQVVADWTGIPAGAMLEDDVARLLELEERLRDRVLGQPEAIGELADTLRVGKAGIANPDAPLGVFLLIGPSGVGKTECARAIADLLFGGDRFLVTINMSEYQEAHTVSQLKGSPPGYVGYGEGGVLTEAVRQHPYSVVLLDEVEKAHRDVLNLFYQVFDKGFMRDGEGREIDFRNTVIIMTSNVGSEEFLQVCGAGESDGEPHVVQRPTPDQMRELARLLLMKQFAPALLARMRIVPFYPLGHETMRDIVGLKMRRVADRVHQAHRIDFRIDDGVVARIAERCTEVESGARNVDAIIDRTILPQVSRALLMGTAGGEAARALTLGLGAEGGFTYTFTDAVAAPDAAPVPETEPQAELLEGATV